MPLVKKSGEELYSELDQLLTLLQGLLGSRIRVTQEFTKRLRTWATDYVLSDLCAILRAVLEYLSHLLARQDFTGVELDYDSLDHKFLTRLRFWRGNIGDISLIMRSWPLDTEIFVKPGMEAQRRISEILKKYGLKGEVYYIKYDPSIEHLHIHYLRYLDETGRVFESAALTLINKEAYEEVKPYVLKWLEPYIQLLKSIEARCREIVKDYRLLT